MASLATIQQGVVGRWLDVDGLNGVSTLSTGPWLITVYVVDESMHD